MERGFYGRKMVFRDMCLIGVLLILAVVMLILMNSRRERGAMVEVYLGGELVSSVPLSEDNIFSVNNDLNVIEILGGKVRMAEASCPDRVCQRQGWIDGVGQSIVCLPNNLVIMVVGGQGEVDFIL